MEVIFLGTGTSQGIPMIACTCPVCSSTNPRNKRDRSSVHVVMDGLHIQVDTVPEFRLQCIREHITWTDFVILTHGHADHILGMDDLRRFCDQQGGIALDVYSTDEGIQRIKSIFPYAIGDRPIVSGYAAFHTILMPRKLELPQGTIESTLLPHGSLNTLGLVFTEKSSGKKFTYYTDCKTVPPEAMELAKGSDLVVLDALRPIPHRAHMTVFEAIEVAKQLDAPQTYFTHITHTMEHEEWSAKLPPKIAFGYDGLRVKL